MTRTVLADTGPLYAAVDPDDQYHARAQEQLKALADQGLSVVLAYPMLLETYTLIRYRLGSASAAAWLDDVREGCSWINPSPQDYREATALVGRFPDQSITLFDATLAIMAARLNLPVWTYDHHFDTIGLCPSGTAGTVMQTRALHGEIAEGRAQCHVVMPLAR